MTDRETMPIMHGKYLKAIPWALIADHERQAQDNHAQTLERLAERGGLAPSEALCIIKDERWKHGRTKDDYLADELTLINRVAIFLWGPRDGSSVIDEREQCAVLAESFGSPQDKQIAEAIRGR